MDSSKPVLGYEPAEPPGRITGRHIRWGLLVAGVWLVGMALLWHPTLEIGGYKYLWGGIYGTPAAPITPSELQGPHDDDRRYKYFAGLYTGIFFLSQWLLLLPHGGLRMRTSKKGRSMKWSCMGAALMAMLLTTGVVAIVLDLGLQRWPVFVDQDFTRVWITMGVLWAAWAWVFWRYARSLDQYTALTRMFRGLIGGTILEMFIAVPAFFAVPAKNKDDCYCARGSYTALVFGLTAAFWLFGPGVFLLFLREKRRREMVVR